MNMKDILSKHPYLTVADGIKHLEKMDDETKSILNTFIAAAEDTDGTFFAVLCAHQLGFEQGKKASLN